MVVVVRERRGVGAPLVAGMMVGGAMAHRREERREQQMMTEMAVASDQAAIRQANANAELARAEAEALRRQTAAQPAVAAAAPGMVSVMVVVPAGVSAGMPFNVESGGRSYSVTCPAGVFAGQTLNVQLPAPTPVVAVAAAPAMAVAAAPAPAPAPAPSMYPSNPSASNSGKNLFREAMLESSAPPPPALSANELVLTANHLVDENSPQMRQFGIISLPAGTFVTLVEGDLVNGLGASYKDYIRVLVPSQGGRHGMISRLVVKPVMAGAGAAMPPPAIGF
jgi:hypothetical protein